MKLRSLSVLTALAVAVTFASAPGIAADTCPLRIPQYPKSLRECLRLSWKSIKRKFVESDGRVAVSKSGESTSESQSYGMLISAWSDDQSTFDKIWKWTEANLFNRNDLKRGPFAWKWSHGKVEDFGSATDADQDIAFSLLLAYSKWHKKIYLDSAKIVLNRLWQENTIALDKSRIVLAGEWARYLPKYKLNPSYFAPACYRVFADFDKDHDWNLLIESSYAVLDRDCSLSKTDLPGDWCEIDPATGEVSVSSPNDAIYSYDALRVPWRVACDSAWFGSEKAAALLRRMNFLRSEWKQKFVLKGGYSPEGIPVRDEQLIATYATTMSAACFVEPDVAKEIFSFRILPSFREGLFDPQDFYQNAWVWLSLALATGQLTPPLPPR